MGWAVYCFIALFAVLAIALASMVRADIRFQRDGSDDHLIIRLRALYGLVRYTLEIPVITFGLFDGLVVEEKLRKANRQQALSSNKKKIDRRDIIRAWTMFKILLDHTAGLREWVRNVLKRVRCGELCWSTVIGAGGAPETAIAAGAVWAVKTSALGALLNMLRLETKPDIAVQPDFQSATFQTSFQCRISMRLGYIVYASLLLLIRIVTVRGGIKTWRHVLFGKRRRAREV